MCTRVRSAHMRNLFAIAMIDSLLFVLISAKPGGKCLAMMPFSLMQLSSEVPHSTTGPHVAASAGVSHVGVQVRPADDAATHPGRPPGSAVQLVRGRRTTASPSVPRVRALTV